jgi:hypothetical protein
MAKRCACGIDPGAGFFLLRGTLTLHDPGRDPRVVDGALELRLPGWSGEWRDPAPANGALGVEKIFARESNGVAGEAGAGMRRERRELTPRVLDVRERSLPRLAAAACEDEEP